MKILWLDINSSYSHSSVALPAIHAQVCDRDDWEWMVVRGTINDNPGVLAAKVAAHKPDIIAATFWLFTHRMQIEVLSRVSKLLGNVRIVCGGPEFLGDNEEFLRQNCFVTSVLRGEGENAFPELIDSIDDQERWESIHGLCWISDNDGTYHDNGTAIVDNYQALRFPEESPFFCWDKPFVQLETTRGCFNSCTFCVSGRDNQIRSQSIRQVKDRLDNICSHGIKDVRVLDRTFNHDTGRACKMLDLFREYEGKMRFHLEIHPSLLHEILRQKLASLPAGLLHLEAGMQSLDSLVLAECGRKGSLKSSLDGLIYLCSLDNIQTHADLIAGLPSYTLQMLCSDIVTLTGIGVDELQVESLKVLPGTRMRDNSDGNGLKYSPLPPYEVLETRSMSPQELRMAMNISRMLDFYYNQPAWQSIIRTLIASDPDFLVRFTLHLMDTMVLDSPLSLERRGLILYDYCLENHPEMISSVTVAWIQAGFSFRKKPAGKVMKIKHIESFISDCSSNIHIEYGNPYPSHRYFLIESGDRRILFGYDSENHNPAPVFMATIF